MMRARVVPALAIALLCSFSSGCGKKGPEANFVKVKGTVYLDGKAYGPGRLTLTPASSGKKESGQSTAGGTIKADGTFVITSRKEGDGAVPGEYTVTLTAGEADAASTDPSKMMAAYGGAIPTKPLTIKIPEGGTDSLEIKFESVKTAKKKPKKGAIIGSPP